MHIRDTWHCPGGWNNVTSNRIIKKKTKQTDFKIYMWGSAVKFISWSRYSHEMRPDKIYFSTVTFTVHILVGKVNRRYDVIIWTFQSTLVYFSKFFFSKRKRKAFQIEFFFFSFIASFHFDDSGQIFCKWCCFSKSF